MEKYSSCSPNGASGVHRMGDHLSVFTAVVVVVVVVVQNCKAGQPPSLFTSDADLPNTLAVSIDLNV